MGVNETDKKRRSIDFSVKASWLAFSKLYNMLGIPHGLTHSNGFVLLNINTVEGTPATKIAPSLGMEARSLTRMLKTMEENGWITKEADAHDKRKAIIKLTEIGREKRELSRITVKYVHHKIAKMVNQEDMEKFFKVIETVNDVIDDLMENPPTQETYEREILGADEVFANR